MKTRNASLFLAFCYLGSSVAYKLEMKIFTFIVENLQKGKDTHTAKLTFNLFFFAVGFVHPCFDPCFIEDRNANDITRRVTSNIEAVLATTP